jgi:hypothetical protein
LYDRINDNLQKKNFGLCAVYKKSDGRFIGFMGFNILRFTEIYSFTSKINLRSEKVFDHPNIENGDRLLRHLINKLIKKIFPKFRC